MITVPAIETSTGVKLAQTLAIARYVARATGLDCDCETIHYCDMMAQATGIYNLKKSLKGPILSF